MSPRFFKFCMHHQMKHFHYFNEFKKNVGHWIIYPAVIEKFYRYEVLKILGKMFGPKWRTLCVGLQNKG